MELVYYLASYAFNTCFSGYLIQLTNMSLNIHKFTYSAIQNFHKSRLILSLIKLFLRICTDYGSEILEYQRINIMLLSTII